LKCFQDTNFIFGTEIADIQIYNNMHLVCMENTWTTLNSQFYAKTTCAKTYVGGEGINVA